MRVTNEVLRLREEAFQNGNFYCHVCKQELPRKLFALDTTRSKYGLRHFCRICGIKAGPHYNPDTFAERVNRILHPESNIIQERKCFRCQQVRPIDDFIRYGKFCNICKESQKPIKIKIDKNLVEKAKAEFRCSQCRAVVNKFQYSISEKKCKNCLGEKRCIACQTEKSVLEFFEQRGANDGYTDRCMECFKLKRSKLNNAQRHLLISSKYMEAFVA